MSRTARIVRNVAIGLAAFLVLILAAALIVVRTDRFQNYLRQKIVTAIAEGTGGATEIGSFTFDFSHLHARLTNLVIHGSEPPGSAPFVRVAQIDLYGRLFGGGRILGISYLGIQRPEINVLVYADGRTNLPTPQPSAPSKDTPLATVVDLAIGHFELREGVLSFNSRPQPLDIQANHVHAQLWYRLLQHDYVGQLAMEPIYVVSGRNTPVTYTVSLPLVLERDRIRLQNASIATATSAIRIDASMENLRQPVFSGRIQGRLTLADLKNTAGLDMDTSGRGLPDAVELDASATASSGSIQVSTLKIALGQSNIQASGVLKDSRLNSSLQFNGDLALAQLARMFRVSTRPEGSLLLKGQATLDANNNYDVTADIFTRGLALQQGSLRIYNTALSTNIHVRPARIELTNLRLDALGGEFAGGATLDDFARYRLSGNLRHFDIQALGQLLQDKLPYSGAISGPVEASGDLHAPAGRGVNARANLTIAPGSRGIPLEGRLDADYSGSADDVSLRNSYLALPHTRLTLAGSVRRGLDISLTTRDLHDLLAAAPSAASPPVTLAGGQAGFTGTVTGKLASPRIAGHLAAAHFQVEGRQFDALNVDVAAAANGASVNNGTLTRGTMSAAFAGSVGMRDWTPGPREGVSANATIQNGDLADIMVMAGQPNGDFSGALNASLSVGGVIGNPSGSADLHVANGTLRGEPFDRLDAQVNLADKLATIPSATLAAGNARVVLSAEFQHPRDSFTAGRIHAHIQTNQIDLAQVRNLQKPAPDTAGQVQLTADVSGQLEQTPAEFLATSVQADGSVHALRSQGQDYGDLQVKARTSGQTATVDLTSDFARSTVRVHGTTQLVRGYPTAADLQVTGLPVERVLAVARRSDIPVRGKLSAQAHLSGTLDQPQGDATLDLTNAVVYEEPLDRVQARIGYLPQRIDVSQFEVVSGPSRIALTARFDHPVGHLDTWDLAFRIEDSHVDLARSRNLQKLRPGLAGTVQLGADGSAKLSTASPPVLLTSLNANVATSHLATHGQNLGGFTLAAHTTSGNRLDFTLNSDLAGSTIQASGNGQLGAGYPIDARLSFSNVKWSNVQKLLGPPAAGPPTYDASVEGKVTVSGPAMQPDGLRGSLELTRLQLQTLPQPSMGRPVTIQNQGPIAAKLDRGTVTIDSFHIAGPGTDIQVSGSVATQPGKLNVTVGAGVDLAILRSFSREIISSGNIKLTADVRGTMSDPRATGRLELHNANINYEPIPNGLSNANGTVTIQGNRASIQSLTAETGGGKIKLSGFATISDNYRFALHASASGVRVRVQEGVSIGADADVQLSGILANSRATGTVTLTQLTYAPQSDLGSMLTRAAPPVESSTTPDPLLDNMKLDIRVHTSPAMRVQSSLAEGLQTDADLRVGGTASEPSVLGRINLDQGKLSFFGSTYNVNSGSISFFNPARIAPILNLSLETQLQGVDIVLNVAGPLDNMKLTYTSDPPLQFQEIIALLSTGTTPTSDPTILANQPTAPPQTFEQRGESAIVSQAVANPVASRLQRVFGVTQLKIDPTFTGSSALPTAQLTLQQRISSNITFTYVSSLDNPNSTLIRAEWALNERWSAMAMRDQNGIVSVNLLYKKQFR